MILKLREWCEGIIIAIIISIIIEMLIPDNKSKKYVKVVIGIYIMFVSLNPILEVINYDFDFSNIFNYETIEATSTNLDNNIKDVYVLGIEEKIKEDVEELGYNIENVKVEVDSNYEQIEKILLKIGSNSNSNIIKIEEINIGKEENKKQNYLDIVAMLIDNYSVEDDKIIIN